MKRRILLYFLLYSIIFTCSLNGVSAQSPSASPSPSASASMSPSPSASTSPSASPSVSPSPSPSPKTYVLSDYDGDGLSDFGNVEDQNDGSPNELVYRVRLSSNASVERTEFGKGDDLQAHGDYDGDGYWDFGVIQERDDAYYWSVKYGSGGKSNDVAFGAKNDVLIAGCDLNGNRISELAIIRAQTLLYQEIDDTQVTAVDLLLNPQGSIRDATCLDADNDQTQELLVLEAVPSQVTLTPPKKPQCKRRKSKAKRKRCRKRYRKRRQNYKKQKDNQEIEYRYELHLFSPSGEHIVSHSVSSNTLGVLGADINNDGLEEIGTYRKLSKKQYSFYFFVDGTEGAVPIQVDSFDSLTAGTFSAADTTKADGVIMDQNNGFHGLYVFSDLQMTLLSDIEGESLLKGINVHLTGDASNADPTGQCAETQDSRDGAGGFLWKEAEHGGLVVLFPDEYQSTFQSVDVSKNGKVVGELYFTGYANGNRQHWRHRDAARSFPKNSIVRAHSNKQTLCWTVADTAVRND